MEGQNRIIKHKIVVDNCRSIIKAQSPRLVFDLFFFFTFRQGLDMQARLALNSQSSCSV